jgi:GNAT superfamily N-acetyltransferase
VSWPFRIEALAKHDRSSFDCGTAELNTYLQKQASQDQRRRFTVCFLLIDSANDKIAGYYTLAAASVLLSDLPEATRKKLPRYPSVPVVRIGRLAIALSYQARGLGGALLADAIIRAGSTEMGVYAVIVDAKDAAAAAFYEHHGFKMFESAPQVMFLPIGSEIRGKP